MGNKDKINILIVDDVPDKLLVLRSILEELDENVLVARSGEEALRKVLENDFAVILLDVNMPGMDGLETARLIRRRRKSAHTPIIFITGYADELHTAEGYSLGAVDYILTPVVPDVLRTKVRVFVELARMTQQARREAEERAAREAAEEVLRHTTFLAEASKVLSASLDYEATVRSLLRLVVPRLADAGAVAVRGEGDGVRSVELAWIEDEDRLATRNLPGRDPLPNALDIPLRRVLAGGQSEYLPHLEARSAAPGERSPPFALKTAAFFPLTARGRVLGALALAFGPSGRSYDASELAMAEDLAGRAAVALDNARLYRDVQEADRRKNEFLSMLAHELRNPLAPIRNAVQVLKLRGPQMPELVEMRGMIDRQVQHLVRMVDDLLDISRITRGKIRLQKEPVDVAAVVERALETSRPLLEERHHQFTLSLPREPLRVKADVVRLAQVLTNLLNNAAKYTEEGGQVALGVERSGTEVLFRVRDSGMGIPPEMLSAVFDLFTQVDRSMDRSQGGLGIGLTLVQRLVELHGGTVEAHSDGPNQGSEFIVRLPLYADERPSPPARPPSDGAGPGAGRRRKVLVVDDNVDSAESLAVLLRLQGHEVQVAHSGPEALATAEGFGPEVVLLDLGLPGMDGYEVARRLRHRPGSRPVLAALTGYGQEEDRRRSHEAGFDYHFVKPIDLEGLTQVFAAPPRSSAIVQAS